VSHRTKMLIFTHGVKTPATNTGITHTAGIAFSHGVALEDLDYKETYLIVGALTTPFV
jgi:hypothetical protein